MGPTEWALVALGGWVIVAVVIALALAVAETRRHRPEGTDVDQVVESSMRTLDDEWAAADREDMTWLWPKQ